jgi:hypothetical protein
MLKSLRLMTGLALATLLAACAAPPTAAPDTVPVVVDDCRVADGRLEPAQALTLVFRRRAVGQVSAKATPWRGRRAGPARQHGPCRPDRRADAAVNVTSAHHAELERLNARRP